MLKSKLNENYIPDYKYREATSIIANDLSTELFVAADQTGDVELRDKARLILQKHGSFDSYEAELDFILSKASDIKKILLNKGIRLRFTVKEIVNDGLSRLKRR